MSLLVAGINLRTLSPQAVRAATESFSDSEFVLNRLLKSDHINEALVLITCQRCEIYADVSRYHGAVSDIRSLFAHNLDLPVSEIGNYSAELHDEAAVRHLFALAAGTQSVVLGEGEILAQISQSWDQARHLGATRSVLNHVFRHALMVGKRTRRETSIAKGTTSIAGAALSIAERSCGGLAGKAVLLIGAGDVIAGAVTALGRYRPGRVTVANRSLGRAKELADRVEGSAITLDQLEHQWAQHDVVLSATGSAEVVVNVDVVAGGGPSVVIDLAMPSDLPEVIGELPDVEFIDLVEVEQQVNASRSQRHQETPIVLAIVDEELRRYQEHLSVAALDPVIASMHEAWEQIRKTEVEKLLRNSTFSADQRAEVELFTKSLVAKLVHRPTTELKSAAGTDESEQLAATVRRLFQV